MQMNLYLNERHDIDGPDILFLSKTTRCNYRLHIYTSSQEFLNVFFSDKCCSSELSIHQRNPKKFLLHCLQHNNNNNNKCFLSSKTEYLNDLIQRDHVTGVMMLKIQL